MRTASRPFSLGVIKCASAAANVWRDSARLSARAFFDAQHAFVAPMQGIGSRLGTDPTGVMPRRNVWFAGALTVSKPQPVPCSTAPALPPLACAPIYPGRAGPGGLAGPLGAMDGAHEPPWVKAHCSRGTASHAAERPAASGWAGPRSGVYGVSRQPTRASQDVADAALGFGRRCKPGRARLYGAPPRPAFGVKTPSISASRAVNPSIGVHSQGPGRQHRQPQRNFRLKVVDKAPLLIWQQRSTQPNKKNGGASFHSPPGFQ
ncbi:hypothetical protein ABIA71_000978 [Stenotrophomonas sp. 2619]